MGARNIYKPLYSTSSFEDPLLYIWHDCICRSKDQFHHTPTLSLRFSFALKSSEAFHFQDPLLDFFCLCGSDPHSSSWFWSHGHKVWSFKFWHSRFLKLILSRPFDGFSLYWHVSISRTGDLPYLYPGTWHFSRLWTLHVIFIFCDGPCWG